MGTLKRSFILFLAFVLASGCQPSTSTYANENVVQISSTFQNLISNSDKSVATKLNIQLQMKSFDDESSAMLAAQNLLSQNSGSINQTNIISSDNFQFLQQLGQNQSVSNGRNFLVLNDSISRFTGQSLDYIKKSYKDDKIGFVIAIYTTALETMMWVHVAPLSTLAMSANIAFTIASAVYFRLNKDKWTELTEKIKMPLKKFFNDVDTNSVQKRIFYDFVSNLGLSTALAVIRVPMMSMNQILDEGLSLGLFKMPVLMSIVGTASLFSWSEHQGEIDKDTHPISRFVFRRASELRSVILVTFASTAALLNPASFGIMPWVTLTIVGAAGFVTYLKGREINDWVERSPLFKNLEGAVRLNTEAPGVLYCRALFY